MTLPVTEDFTGDADVQLADPPWTPMRQHNPGRLSYDGAGKGKNVGGGSGVYVLSFWNADAFDDDQYAEIVVDTAPGLTNDWQLAAVRCSGTIAEDSACYLIEIDGNASRIKKLVNNIFSTIMVNPLVLAVQGDRVGLRVDGNSLTWVLNGVDVESWIDNTLTSGAAGAGVYPSTDNLVRIDDWEGGNSPMEDFATSDEAAEFAATQILG